MRLFKCINEIRYKISILITLVSMKKKKKSIGIL